jgi:transposase
MATRRHYDPDIVPKVIRLTEAGFTPSEVAELLDIPKKTFFRWAEAHPELSEAIEADPIIAGKRELLNRVGGSKYRPAFDKMAYKHCLLGATNKELAAFFDVDTETLRRWKGKYPSFARAIHAGKDEADANVAKGLYHRAIGYEHTAIHFAQAEGKIIGKRYTKHYAPDTAAAIFWLKNRKPESWRDKREIVLEDADELTPWSDIEDADDLESE